MTITNFSIEYDAINDKNTFTNGDTINGRIILEVSKETKVQSLTFIASGKSRVVWTEHYGQYNTRVYWADEKYYEVKHHILRKLWENGSEFVGKGRNVYPFTFQIPDKKMPSSFKDCIGKVVHKVKAELKQSMKLSKKAKAHLTFVSKPDLDIPGLMEPQYACKDKTISFVGSGCITMDVYTMKMGYMQGEGIKVTAEINNNCSRSVKPKFVLYEKKSYFAQGHRKLNTRDVLKEKVDSIASGSSQIVRKVIDVPRELPPSITNCSIFKLEYRLKIYLDIKYAADPKIKLSIVVLPPLKSKKKAAAEPFPVPVLDVNPKKQPQKSKKSFEKSNQQFENQEQQGGNSYSSRPVSVPHSLDGYQASGDSSQRFDVPQSIAGNTNQTRGDSSQPFGVPHSLDGYSNQTRGDSSQPFGVPHSLDGYSNQMRGESSQPFGVPHSLDGYSNQMRGESSQPFGVPHSLDGYSNQMRGESSQPFGVPHSLDGYSNQMRGESSQPFGVPHSLDGYSNQACAYPVTPFENPNQNFVNPYRPTTSHQPYQRSTAPYSDPPPLYSTYALYPRIPPPESYEHEF